MTNNEVLMVCRGCGRAETEFTMVSEHYASHGMIRYVRCTACGSLQVLSRSRLDRSERVLVGATAPTASAA